MSNPTKIKKKLYDYELATEQSYYKNYGERNTFVFSYFFFNEILLI